jgi:hypothetical protein
MCHFYNNFMIKWTETFLLILKLCLADVQNSLFFDSNKLLYQTSHYSRNTLGPFLLTKKVKSWLHYVPNCIIAIIKNCRGEHLQREVFTTSTDVWMVNGDVSLIKSTTKGFNSPFSYEINKTNDFIGFYSIHTPRKQTINFGWSFKKTRSL